MILIIFFVLFIPITAMTKRINFATNFIAPNTIFNIFFINI